MTERPVHPISILGLPGSGKTTFLAALWHLVQSGEIPTKLAFKDLRYGNYQHLNQIAARWRRAIEQDRTQIAGMQTVSMDLEKAESRTVRVTFPDVPGEDYRRMWEEREIGKELIGTLATGNVLLLLNGDRIEAPHWVYDEAELGRKLNIKPTPGEILPWQPCFAPTQVQLVSLLQNLRQPPLDCGPRRLAVMVSVWDKASGERRAPEPFIAEKLSFLHQYLASGRDGWDWRAYGVSAQGGEYDSTKEGEPPKPEAETLRRENIPSHRINIVDGTSQSHDLTEPIEWLAL